MTVLSFIKENRVLFVALTLLILITPPLIAPIPFAKGISELIVPLPKSKVMYYTGQRTDKGTIEIKVNNEGKLAPVFFKSKNYNLSSNQDNPTIMFYLYDPKTDTVEEESITIDKNGIVTALEKFKDIKLSTNRTSSDGYKFIYNDIADENWIQHSKSPEGPILIKYYRILHLPPPRVYYDTVDWAGIPALGFVGWEE